MCERPKKRALDKVDEVAPHFQPPSIAQRYQCCSPGSLFRSQPADVVYDTQRPCRTDTAPFAPRTHRSFSAAADEANNSRVYGGIHFRSAVRDGRKIGDSVGRLVMDTLMRPLQDDDD